MSSFISEKFNVDLVEAKKIQKEYFYEYGTTLSGLMKKKNVDPNEFLEFVHDIDISWLPKDKLLREELRLRSRIAARPVRVRRWRCVARPPALARGLCPGQVPMLLFL